MSCKILGFPDFPRVNFSAPNFTRGVGLRVVCLFGLVWFLNSGTQGKGILATSAFHGFRKLHFKAVWGLQAQ